ncbi:hypothetical protein MPER_12132, partial [Moniliophthora perniciosa FA553]
MLVSVTWSSYTLLRITLFTRALYIECRAWTTLAELGMTVIGGGFSHDNYHLWARDIENEVEEATTKGLNLAQKHPTLRWYRSQLAFLAAQLAIWQNNVKFARTLLRRQLTT